MDSGGSPDWKGDCREKLHRFPAQSRTCGRTPSGAPSLEQGQLGDGSKEEGDAAGRKGRGLGGGEEGVGVKTWGWEPALGKPGPPR